MNKIIKAHRFFVDMTPEYVGAITGTDIFGYPIFKMNIKQMLHYPIAYIKFMYLSLK